MGFRFYKSFRVIPGVRLNLSKSGISTSVGGPGANLNFRGKRRRLTVGLPGTGLSYVHQRTSRRAEMYLETESVAPEVGQPGANSSGRPPVGIILIALVLAGIVIAVVF